MARLSTIASLAGALLLAGFSASAQERRPAPQPGAEAAQPADSTPQGRVDRLFERLRDSKDATEANGIAGQILRSFARSGSDTADLLFTRVGEAMRAQDHVLALDLLDTVLALEPQWAEALARRASVHIQRKDFDAAMRDLRAALALEPRHFMALAGLGSVFNEVGNPKRALAAFREALKLHPHLEQVKKAVERLAAEHDGRDI
jgi:tetratricopeptide (TPR) repeat protein